MNLITSLTIVLPVVLITSGANRRLRSETSGDQIKTGGFLMALLIPAVVGMFSVVPGGSFSAVPASLRQEFDYVLTLALAPLSGAFLLAVSLIWRGLKRSKQQILK